MKLISHRGNIDGIKRQFENKPDYIIMSIKSGYDVEVDIRYIDNGWYLGHDKPDYKVNFDFICNDKLWLHCKNIESFYNLVNMWDDNIRLNYFWHQNDNFTLTSNGYIWTYPGNRLTNKSICVLPELVKDQDLSICYAVCSDYIIKYK